MFSDAPGKFRGRVCVAQLNAADLAAAAAEMNVGVNKTGKDAFALGIDLPGRWSNPLRNVGIGAHGDDAAAMDGKGLGLWVLAVYRPDMPVKDDHVGEGGLLGVGTHASKWQDKRRQENESHESLQMNRH